MVTHARANNKQCWISTNHNCLSGNLK